jgi:hypothetical protein
MTPYPCPDPYADPWGHTGAAEDERALSIPLTSSDIAVIDRLAGEVQRWAVLEPSTFRRIMALSRSLHMRAGAAGRGHHVPLIETELRTVEAALETARKGAYSRASERLVKDVQAALRRWYERVGAARVLTIRGVHMFATDPE